MQDTKQNLDSGLLSLFTAEQLRCKYYDRFVQSELGQLYLTIPFQELAQQFPKKKHKCGVKPWFKTTGGLGLMFLKHRYNLSDEKLIETLNDNWKWQRFCGIRLGEGEQIKDAGVVSRWRGFFGRHIDLDKLQKVFINAWLDDMEQTQSNVSDATCYESYVRYPTDVKLLWECIEWLHKEMLKLCSYCSLRQPRNKYKDQKRKYKSYSKQKRKTYKQTRKIKKRLLYLLDKLRGQIQVLIGGAKLLDKDGQLGHDLESKKSPLTARFFERLGLIKRVYHQQYHHFIRPDVPIKNRIISLAKPYLRPIVRGKEIKRVEFGIKNHNMRVGKLNWIEYWDFEAFHEGVRMKSTIFKHRSYFGRLDHFDGDLIYANNKNRKFCTQRGIFTGFKRKGKASKNEAQAQILRKALNKERSTELEGSFGNEKNHYGLRKVKARNKFTEMAWVFFGIMTANATKVMKKINAPPKK